MSHLFSRSDVEEYWRCPRAAYWRRVYGGRGLEPVENSLALFAGTVFHGGTQQLLEGKGVEHVAHRAHVLMESELRSEGVPQWVLNVGVDPDMWIAEQAALAEGMIRGFHRGVLPMLKSMGEIVHLEKEVTKTEGELTMMTQPDVLIQPPEQEGLLYVEYKTVKAATPGWFKQWLTAPQFAAAALAVKETLGREVENYMVIGALKGDYDDGWQHSPYCWGWVRDTGDRAYEFKNARTKGWYRMPVWEMEGGVRQWVEEMPLEVLTKQFPATMPIPVEPMLMEAYWRQTCIREGEIAGFLQLEPETQAAVMDGVFPQYFSHCNPPMGFSCWANQLCWQPQVAADPIASGKFVWRVSHHEMERKKHEQWREGTAGEGAAGVDSDSVG